MIRGSSKNVDVIIQARMASSRLPGKILKKACNKPLLQLMIERVKRSAYVRKVIVATTTGKADDMVGELCDELNVDYFRGSEEDVLSRVLETAKYFKTDIIVGLTGDCPLIDPSIIDKLVEIYVNNDYDFVSNCLERTFPRGLDVEIHSAKLLDRVSKLTCHALDREHVTIYIYSHPEQFKLFGIEADVGLRHPEYRLTLDTHEDYVLIKTIYEELYYKNPEFNSYDIIELLKRKSELMELNRHTKQNQVVYYE